MTHSTPQTGSSFFSGGGERGAGGREAGAREGDGKGGEPDSTINNEAAEPAGEGGGAGRGRGRGAPRPAARALRAGAPLRLLRPVHPIPSHPGAARPHLQATGQEQP